MGDGQTVLERMNDRMARSDLSARMHRLAYRLSRGRAGGAVRGLPVLLLTTTGRRTGRERTVPLIYLRDDDRLVVVASNAADPERPPGWWLNLEADPRATVQIGGRAYRAEAHLLPDAERDRLWPRLAAHNHHWDRFQAEATRRFGVASLSLGPER